MRRYPKQILSASQQVQSYIDAGMAVTSIPEAEAAMLEIGYYRLRGYCYHLYDNSTKQTVHPSKSLFSSWIYACSALRNICAHNSRIYNRAIDTTPEILLADRVQPVPRYTGLYQIVLAMKYLRPSDDSWNNFNNKLQSLFTKYQGVFEYARINFPVDWKKHMII